MFMWWVLFLRSLKKNYKFQVFTFVLTVNVLSFAQKWTKAKFLCSLYLCLAVVQTSSVMDHYGSLVWVQCWLKYGLWCYSAALWSPVKSSHHFKQINENTNIISANTLALSSDIRSLHLLLFFNLFTNERSQSPINGRYWKLMLSVTK